MGAETFGYDNVPVVGPSGERSHVERAVNDEQKAVVRRIFALSAAGSGLARIAKQLNTENAPAPKPKRGRLPGWSASAVRVILHRRLYLGEVVWGRTKKRDKDGQTNPSRRPETEWIRTHDENLRIISDAEWAAVHDRLTGVRQRLQATGDALGNRRPPRVRDADSQYLLSGFARCSVCGSALGVLSGGRSSSHRRVYGCTRYPKTGPCSNGLPVEMSRVDTAVLNAIADDVLGEHVVKA